MLVFSFFQAICYHPIRYFSVGPTQSSCRPVDWFLICLLALGEGFCVNPFAGWWLLSLTFFGTVVVFPFRVVLH